MGSILPKDKQIITYFIHQVILQLSAGLFYILDLNSIAVTICLWGNDFQGIKYFNYKRESTRVWRASPCLWIHICLCCYFWHQNFTLGNTTTVRDIGFAVVDCSDNHLVMAFPYHMGWLFLPHLFFFPSLSFRTKEVCFSFSWCFLWNQL